MGNHKTTKWAKLAARAIAVTFVAQIAIPATAQTTGPADPTPAAGATAAAAPAPYTGPRMPLLIFPFDSSEIEQEGDFLGRAVAKGVKDGTLRSPRYNGISYNPKNAIVQRALSEGLLKESEARGPFGGDPLQVSNAVRVAQVMGVSDFPLVMVGSVNEFEMDRTQNRASLTVTAQVVDVSSGMVVETIVSTGTSPEGMVIGSDEQFAMRAAENATNLLVAKMVPPTVVPDQVVTNNGTTDNNTGAANGETTANGAVPEAEPKKKKKNNGLFAVLAILLGAAILGGGGGGGGGGSVIDNPPAPPF